MLQPTPLRDQIDASRGDRLRVLIVGAGVAGLTLAGLLRRRGLHPVLVERAGPDAPSGYMLALMPLVDPVLEALGAVEAYTARSVGMDRYRLRDRRGALIGETSMRALLSDFGDYRGIGRGELMDVLASRGGPVSHGLTVTALERRGPAVAARIGGTEAEFDAVIAADGLRSATRGLVLRPERVRVCDTGWGGWVVWAGPDADEDLGEELWGVGSFAGTYPVKDRIGLIVCGPREAKAAGLDALVARLRARAPQAGTRMARVLAEAVDGREQYYWSLTDCRSDTWSVGRVGLVGDAAAGFLPTAGIGAAMAMESAWVLADRLADCEAGRVEAALADYERAQRPRVEAAQGNSRRLARLMFNESRAAAAVRDTAARLLPLSAALGPIRRLLETRPAGLG
ncbi:MAG TPA: NAD(P)/FAD-dependent oxidoreductase [Glycomyces sp.]|nr:NAD(P)/FAD-dependent oxidoreductase [Glycomyces sp.]